jgi:hypothetical protein
MRAIVLLSGGLDALAELRAGSPCRPYRGALAAASDE